MLDHSLRQFVGYRLKRTYNGIRADLTRQLEPLGLRITTYSCLLLIAENPGVRQSDLADALDIERPNLVAILDELKTDGRIYRERDPADRRAFGLYCTPAGKRVCKKAAMLNAQQESRYLKGLSKKERETLRHALTTIESSLNGRHNERK